MISRRSSTLRRTVAPLLSAMLLGMVVAVGCQPTGPQVVTLKATEFAFTPTNVNLKVGQVVQLSIPNDGAVDHDLKSEIPIANLTYQQADNPLDEQRENIVNFDQGTTLGGFIFIMLRRERTRHQAPGAL